MTSSRKSGFTLLEVLVAFTIAALALIVLYRSSGESIGAVEVSGRYTQAASRAQSHLATLSAQTSFAAGESEGDDGDGFRWHIVISPASARQDEAALASERSLKPLPARLYAITVDIWWQENAHRRTFTLNTMNFGSTSAEPLQ